MESKKKGRVVVRGLGAGQEWRRRRGEGTWGHGKGEGWAGMKWESGMDIYTLPNVRRMAGEGQPHGAGGSARCFVTT